nr:tyrosine-type recombinase/integrase [Paenibacillus alba]
MTDPELISDVLDYLRESNMRNYMLFSIGIYTGFRISDILRFRVRDVTGTHISIRERKTKKEKRLMIPSDLRREIKAYVEGRSQHEYLFQSRQGVNRPIGRSMAYKIMRLIADEFRLDEVGCHTLRKTFGYFHYKKNKDIVLLQNHFNHSTYKVTLRYIGELQETMDTSMKHFKIF